MASYILMVCFVLANNSCGNSSCLKYFLFNLNIASFSFFAADFNLPFVYLCIYQLNRLCLTVYYFFNTVSLPFENCNLVFKSIQTSIDSALFLSSIVLPLASSFFLILQQILFIKLLLEQHLVTLVYSNQLLLIYNDLYNQNLLSI